MSRMIFTLMVFVTAFLIYVYPVTALLHLLYNSRIFEPASIIPTVLVTAAMLVYARTRITSPALSAFLHYGLGIGFIGFCVLSIGLLVSLVFPVLSREIGLMCLAIVVAVSAVSLVEGRRLHVKRLELESAKLKESVKFVFVSDVHLGSNPVRHLEHIRTEIDQLDFDFLIIGGDLFDSSAFEPSDLASLHGIGKPVLFVTGNHEHYVRDHEEKIFGLEKHGITNLDDRSTQIKGVNIVGLGDNQPVERQAETARRLIREGKFNLVTVHRPTLWDRIPKGIDLMLSGHTHNGQIFPFKFLVRTRFRAVFGFHRKLESMLYVSSGAGCWGPRMRLGTSNEIVYIAVAASPSPWGAAVATDRDERG